MMDSLRDASDDLANKAEVEVTYENVEELQKFIKRHASSTYTIERRWEFWYPTSSAPAGASSGAAATAGD